MWRPDDWHEIAFNLGFATPYKAISKELGAFNEGVEAGADAMLEALKKQGALGIFNGHETMPLDKGRELYSTSLIMEYQNRMPNQYLLNKKGTLVFIPDKEVK